MPAGAISSAAAAAAVSATVQDAPGVPVTPGTAAQPVNRRDRRDGRDRRPEAATAATANGAMPAAVGEPRRKVHWYWRLLAWIVAVPLGFVLTAWPAYHFGWIKKNDLLDVFVGSGNGRYTRLVVLTLGWALVTALLVQLFVEGGRWLARRRRARKAAGGARGGGPRGRSSGGTRAADAAHGAGGEVQREPSAAAPARRPATSAPR